MRRSLAFVGSSVIAACVLVSADSAADCPTANVHAIELANQADAERKVNLDHAIELYEQAIGADPSNHRILHKLALAQWKKENWKAVERASNAACKLAPTFANYFYTRGVALAHLAERGEVTWIEVKEPLENAVALDPRYAEAHHDLAEALLHLKNEKGALAHYTKAVQLRPTESYSWTALGDLYIRLGLLDHADKTIKEGLTFVEGSKRFGLASLYGQVLEEKHDLPGAAASYEDAKKSCGPCNEPGQQIAYFNLGMAYASLTPPRKSEAMAQLQSFQKMICKGAAAARYADQCTQAQIMASRLGGTLQ